MLPSACATAHTPHSFDQEAFEELAAFADEVETAFELNAIDRGFERLIDRPNRATTGKILAARLMRDARKHLKVNRRREVLSNNIEADDSRTDPPMDMELDEIRFAVEVIREGLMDLSPRERQALTTKCNGASTHDLAVKPRQLRNIVATARMHLRHQGGMEDAYLVVMNGLDR